MIALFKGIKSSKDIFNASVIGAVMASLMACTSHKGSNDSHVLTFDIFANRPAGAVDDLFIFTLNSPALLQVANHTDTGWSIPDDAKQAVLKEQSEFEAKLQTLAPNAKIVYRYRLTLNALAVYASSDIVDQLSALPNLKNVSHVRQMGRPEELALREAKAQQGTVNSVNFIGADEAHKLGFTGQGMRVGVLDTGIDYTHKMLGGSGDPNVFKTIDPAQPSALFPNDKVIGGIDLVGSDFNAASSLSTAHLPKPDSNPIDEAGHGSHVAGTIAGLGNGTTTYSGVAPDAKLYAIKVFGKTGSTIDAAVIAGFEYAVDPNGDLDPNDHLDVVNLSLGGGFGQPQVLYTEAVRNVTRVGTVVVASAGNSGSTSYIVGAPSTADDALSVAASVDGADVNWRFAASLFVTKNNPSLLVRAIEGPVSRPIKQSDGVAGELVDIGLSDTDLSDEVKAKLSGKVAFIQRGKNPFFDKIKRAKDAGAIGAVVYNNAPGDPIPMGGNGNVDIPAFMVTQDVGQTLSEEMKLGPVTVQFKTDQFIELPDNIDTITDFSSRGPRSEDNLFKPEIAAPGQNITSAGMGTGDQGVLMDGTSMAAPHMTGAMALIKQAHPNLSVAELKAIAMNTAKLLTDKGSVIPLTSQGAGRIQVADAIKAQVVSETAAISLGRIQLESQKSDSREVILRNLQNREVTLTLSVDSTPGLSIDAPATVTLPALGQSKVAIKFNYDLQDAQSFLSELDGLISFSEGSDTVLTIPTMGVRTQASQIQTSTSASAGSLTLSNASPIPGLATAFNLLGQDSRKSAPAQKDSWMARNCDLRSAGYRIIRSTKDGQAVDKIQFAFKLYSPVTTWHMCSISVLIDKDGDGVADQEIAGVTGSPLEGLQKSFVSLLLDSAKAHDLRLAYEKDLSAGKADASVDYTPAILATSPLAAFDQSTLAVVEAPLSALALTPDGKLRVKLAAQAEGGETFESDDYLGDGLGNWLELSPKFEDQPFYGMSELTRVPSTGAALNATKGASQGQLVLYYPFNDIANKDGSDGQEQILDP